MHFLSWFVSRPLGVIARLCSVSLGHPRHVLYYFSVFRGNLLLVDFQSLCTYETTFVDFLSKSKFFTFRVDHFFEESKHKLTELSLSLLKVYLFNLH